MVLVLAGCTGGGPSVGSSGPPESSDRPVVTASVAPVPSVTPTVSEEERLLAMIPEEAKGDDLLAAVAMAKFFVTLFPELFTDQREPDLFRFLSFDTCEFCSSALDTSQARLDEGLHMTSGAMTPAEGVDQMVLTDTAAFAQFKVHKDAGAYVDQDGAVVQEHDAQDYLFTVQLSRSDGLWRIDGVDYGEQ